MASTRAEFAHRSRAFMPAACTFALVAVLAGGPSAPACAARLHPEYGFTMRGLFGVGEFGDIASPGFGGDFDLHIVNEAGGLGMRAVFGFAMLASDEVHTQATILWWPVSGTYTTSQALTWLAAGPDWSIPRSGGRIEIYLLGGKAWASTSGSGVLINVEDAEPAGTSTWVAIAGAMWVAPIKPEGFPEGFSLEVGGELQFGGPLTFWDDPPFAPDGTGGGTYRTRQSSIGGIGLRLGFNYQRQPHKQ